MTPAALELHLEVATRLEELSHQNDVQEGVEGVVRSVITKVHSPRSPESKAEGNECAYLNQLSHFCKRFTPSTGPSATVKNKGYVRTRGRKIASKVSEESKTDIGEISKTNSNSNRFRILQLDFLHINVQ